jgi:hypothetical protein
LFHEIDKKNHVGVAVATKLLDGEYKMANSVLSVKYVVFYSLEAIQESVPIIDLFGLRNGLSADVHLNNLLLKATILKEHYCAIFIHVWMNYP